MKIIFSFFFFIMTMPLLAQIPTVSAGSIKRFENFKSQWVDARNIDVWLPDGYAENEQYAVLYMHDGQMLYDASTTWNKQAWEVDEVASKLQAEGKTRKFIVVGIWNNGEYRRAEYFPQKIISTIPVEIQKMVVTEQLKNKPQADNYLKFLVTELKPFIDKTFATAKDRKSTFIAGSSMGGLISLYAICEYPKIFGGAACISTHTPMIVKEKMQEVSDEDIAAKFRDYLRKHLPNPNKHKIYFDYGDQTLDSFYKPYQEKIDAVMKEKGFTDKNWTTRFFSGADHSEKSWHERLDIPFMFLLKKAI